MSTTMSRKYGKILTVSSQIVILHISKICALVLLNLFNLSQKKALCFHFSSTCLINKVKHEHSGKIYLF